MKETLESLIKEACSKCEVGLYDTEIISTSHGKVLCVYITKASGINISDCTKVAFELNLFLDTDQTLIDGPFTLEVSSPGLERPLKLKKHYMTAINDTIKITHQLNEKKETITGILTEVHPDFIILKCPDQNIQLPFHSIKKAKTCYQSKKKENV